MSDRKNKPKKFKKRGQESSSSASSSSESTSSLSSDDESNGRDLKPIKEYLSDRKELARQLFIAVKGDKLKMMLPQVLKKMELKELEEWCANELSGMSKARILSILNGQPMLQSSDSNDSDDSGPSLEIISDTEEWGDISDVDITTRDEESTSKKTSGLKKDKTRSKLRAGERGAKDAEKTRSKSLKAKIKSEPDPKSQKPSDVVKVKKETEGSEQTKEKDGESLLDLLELEMRARAIRALIRKEEDIIPANPSSSASAQSSTSNPSPNPSLVSSTNLKTRARDRQLSLKVVQDKLQELDSSFNRSVNKNAQEISEEEDVVLVLQPTTTIELLSSESDDEGGQGRRRNQKLENERILEKNTAKIVQDKGIDEEREKSKLEEAKGREPENESVTNNKNKIASSASTTTENLSTETEKVVEKSPKKVSTDLEMFRMLKKKTPQKELEDNETIAKERSSHCEEKETDKGLEPEKKSCVPVPKEKRQELSSPKNADLEKEEKKELEESVDGVEPSRQQMEAPNKSEKKSESKEQLEMDEDKSTDLEIIIDLDDYPDDMEDLDAGDKRRIESSSSSNPEEKRAEVSKEDASKSANEIEGRTPETWATRYYQTEDVQSVIKESKIQSEIRKRLRERQRLARLNNSPGINAAQSVTPTQTTGAEKSGGEKADSPTTGSVEEYLALKNVETISPCTDQIVIKDPGELDVVSPGAKVESEKTESIDNEEKIVGESEKVADNS